MYEGCRRLKAEAHRRRPDPGHICLFGPETAVHGARQAAQREELLSKIKNCTFVRSTNDNFLTTGRTHGG